MATTVTIISFTSTKPILATTIVTTKILLSIDIAIVLLENYNNLGNSNKYQRQLQLQQHHLQLQQCHWQLPQQKLYQQELQTEKKLQTKQCHKWLK